MSLSAHIHKKVLGHPTRHLLVSLVAALLVVIALVGSFGIPIARAGMLSPRELLNTDGTLNLTTGKAGALDLRGWDVILDPQRGPLLSSNAPAAASWSALG